MGIRRCLTQWGPLSPAQSAKTSLRVTLRELAVDEDGSQTALTDASSRLAEDLHHETQDPFDRASTKGVFVIRFDQPRHARRTRLREGQDTISVIERIEHSIEPCSVGHCTRLSCTTTAPKCTPPSGGTKLVATVITLCGAIIDASAGLMLVEGTLHVENVLPPVGVVKEIVVDVVIDRSQAQPRSYGHIPELRDGIGGSHRQSLLIHQGAQERADDVFDVHIRQRRGI